MSKIFVIGSLNMDLVINAPFMPDNGVTISGSGFMTNPGGKGANQATAIGKLGGNAYMVGCVGNAFGDELIGIQKEYHVNTDFIEKKENVSSGIAVIVVVDGDNRIILDAGANALVSEKLIDRALEKAEKGDYIVCQLEIPLDKVLYAFKLGKKKGVTTVLNPAPAKELPAELLEYCDFFTPNQSETEFYTGIYPDTEEKVIKASKILNEKGVKNLVVTMGKDGSCFVGDGKVIKAKCHKVKAIDTTAAGDTYVGALLTSLSKGKEMADAMEYASKASAITVTRRGAGISIPTAQEVEEFKG